MQAYQIMKITRDQILPIAERMKEAGRGLVMIHGYLDKDGQLVVCWDYAADPDVESYQLAGENRLPSISGVYGLAAAWPERELGELFGVVFEGLDQSQRLFLPEDVPETRDEGQCADPPSSEQAAQRNETKEEP